MVCLLGSFSVSCAFLPPLEGESGQSSIGRQGSNIDGVDSFAGATGGLAIGAVVSANGRDALKPYQRWRYADQLASYILHANPQLHGQVDSYEYVSKRMGKPFANLLKSYRLTGDLDGESLDALRSAELRQPCACKFMTLQPAAKYTMIFFAVIMVVFHLLLSVRHGSMLVTL